MVEIYVLVFIMTTTSLCLMNCYALNCSNLEPKRPVHTLHSLFSSFLWEKFSAHSTQATLNISVTANKSALCQIELYELEHYSCGIVFGKSGLDILQNPTFHPATPPKLLRNLNESEILDGIELYLDGITAGTLYGFQLECSAIAVNRSARTFISKHFTASTAGFTQVPTSLRAFVHYSMFGVTNPSRWGVLEWAPSKYWDTSQQRKYQSKCIQYHKRCAMICRSNFASCQWCVNYNFYIDEVYPPWQNQQDIPASFNVALVPEVEGDGIVAHTSSEGIPENVKEIICSVSAGSFSTEDARWAVPIHVNLTILSPAPRILISGRLNTGKYVTATVSTSATFLSGEDLQILHATDLTKLIHFSGSDTLLNSGMFFMCCKSKAVEGSLVPAISPWPFIPPLLSVELHDIFLNPPLDFCVNWIRKVYYSVSPCSHNHNLTCLYEDDSSDLKSRKLLYQAGPDTPLERVTCNPLSDIIGITQKQSEGDNYNLLVYRSTENSVQKIHVGGCNSSSGDALQIASKSISIDWKHDENILLLDNDGYAFLAEINKENSCSVKKLNKLILSNNGNLKDVDWLTSDWHHFYWVLGNDIFIQQRDGQGLKNVAKPQNFINRMPLGCTSGTRNCETLRNVSFDEIFVLKASAPEMRRILSADEYLPRVGAIEAVMITNATASVDATVEWKSAHLSVRARVSMEIWYKIFQKGDEERGCLELFLGLCNATRSRDYELAVLGSSRSHILTETIPDLKTNETYYIEIHLTLVDQWKYTYKEQKDFLEKNHIFNATFIPIQPEILTKRTRSLWPVWVATGVAVLFLIILLVILCYYYCAKVKPMLHLTRIDKTDIESLEEIGRGNFGKVCQGVMSKNGKNRRKVAVKQLHPNMMHEAKKDFLIEAIILGHLNHRNIIKILGICLDSKAHMIILEFINGGNLQKRLDTKRSSITLHEQLDTAIDICRALVYLSQEGYIQRDIRAANVLIRERMNETFHSAVLADFGLARDQGTTLEPYTTANPQFPIRYSAPECFRGSFTTQSDVFMFGMLLWEIFSFGAVPHPVLPSNFPYRVVYEHLRPPQPIGCPHQIFQMMADCWTKEPADRPKPKKLQLDLKISRRILTLAGTTRIVAQDEMFDPLELAVPAEASLDLHYNYSNPLLPSVGFNE